MKKAPLAAFVLLLVIGATATSDADGASRDRSPRLLKKSIRAVSAGLETAIPSLMQKAGIPGLQIALIRQGKVVWQRGFGVKNAATGEPVTEETLFEAASLTKPFFAYAVMKLVDKGIVDLDRPLDAYFTREEIERNLGHPLDAPGFRRDWFEKITPRHVLSHSGGLPHGERGEVFPVFFEPGTKWKYSADGYELLQHALEKLKGEKLDAIMQKSVLDPLGMKRSGLVWRDDFAGPMANGHSIYGAPQGVRKYREASAAASLYTTAGEYARFICAVLNGEGLKPATAREMLASVIDLNDDQSLGWSLGFGIQRDRNGAAFWQWGDYGIFRNYILAYPRRKAAVVYLTNSFNGLSVCSELVSRSLGGRSLGNVFLNYRTSDSAFYALFREAKSGGPERLRVVLPGLRLRDPKDLTWENLGQMAGLLGDEGLVPESLALLEYVAGENPNSGRAAFDMARGCLVQGDLEKARIYYERAGKAEADKVDPKAIQWDLDYLQAAEHPFALEEEYLRTLAGEYEARQISFKDGRLWYFRVGGASPEPRPLLALSKDTFFVRGTVSFRFKLEFDGQGRPVKLVGLYDDGSRDGMKRTK